MPTILDGLDTIIDQHLGLDETWEGKPPRYKHPTSLIRLCREDDCTLDGIALIHALYDQIESNWADAGEFQARLPSSENWRFQKKADLSDGNESPEVTLERTVASITDDNWANQMPVDSGLLGARAHYIDLVHRSAQTFSLVELKIESNTALSAAFQVVKYGLAYAFSRRHAELLEYKVQDKELLQASSIELRVLAPAKFYPGNRGWLADLETALDDALGRFMPELPEVEIPMSFRFEAFPESFDWSPGSHRENDTRKDLLWALHQRVRVF